MIVLAGGRSTLWLWSIRAWPQGLSGSTGGAAGGFGAETTGPAKAHPPPPAGPAAGGFGAETPASEKPTPAAPARPAAAGVTPALVSWTGTGGAAGPRGLD